MTACHCKRPIPRARPGVARLKAGLAGLAAGLVLAAGAAGAGAPPARADGDPASDVLATSAVFLSGDAGFTGAQARALSGAVARLGGEGLAVRVAVIASPADLGSVTQLWQMPAAYARFLGEELSLVYRGTLLVVMPDGTGLARVAPSGVVPEALPVGPAASGLAAATLAGLTALAGATGHRLSLTGLGHPSPAAAGGASALGSIDPGSIIALVAGAALLAAAWLASLRARPLRSPPA